ncbi:hypothetical protein BKA70DRAFT_1241933 [Coprinopsis sp. MPI-PUGE-AT-0042]|nr:hypothetical protein BKA70DRAFT_1241933 [Coprinopsis sp. MPI-PUGE-AT-0042]
MPCRHMARAPRIPRIAHLGNPRNAQPSLGSLREGNLRLAAFLPSTTSFPPSSLPSLLVTSFLVPFFLPLLSHTAWPSGCACWRRLRRRRAPTTPASNVCNDVLADDEHQRRRPATSATTATTTTMSAKPATPTPTPVNVDAGMSSSRRVSRRNRLRTARQDVEVTHLIEDHVVRGDSIRDYVAPSLPRRALVPSHSSSPIRATSSAYAPRRPPRQRPIVERQDLATRHPPHAPRHPPCQSPTAHRRVPAPLPSSPPSRHHVIPACATSPVDCAAWSASTRTTGATPSPAHATSPAISTAPRQAPAPPHSSSPTLATSPTNHHLSIGHVADDTCPSSTTVTALRPRTSSVPRILPTDLVLTRRRECNVLPLLPLLLTPNVGDHEAPLPYFATSTLTPAPPFPSTATAFQCGWSRLPQASLSALSTHPLHSSPVIALFAHAIVVIFVAGSRKTPSFDIHLQPLPFYFTMVHSPSVPAARTKRARAPTSSDAASAKRPRGEGEDVSDEDVPHESPSRGHAQSCGPVDAAVQGPSTTSKKDKKKKKKKSLDDESVPVPDDVVRQVILVYTCRWRFFIQTIFVRHVRAGRGPDCHGHARWLPASHGQDLVWVQAVCHALCLHRKQPRMWCKVLD